MISCQERKNNRTCKVKVLGSNDMITFLQSSVEPVCTPDPSLIPERISDIDNEVLQDSLSHEDMKKILDNTDTTYTEDKKLVLYWHTRLRHKHQKYIRRLAKRGIIPKRLEKVNIMPMCATCKLANASKINWKSSFSKKGIRTPTDNKPGAGTSCDHLISHEPDLIPQVTRRLTHKRYCDPAIFTDHFSDLIYPHLIQSTSMEETMEGNMLMRGSLTTMELKSDITEVIT